MIPKNRKFPLRTDFLSFRRSASRISSQYFVLYFLPHTPSVAEGKVGRLAVIVPKKCARLATTRSWLKRLTYDTIWVDIKDKNIDVVVVYKPISLKKSEATKKELISDINSLEFQSKSCLRRQV